METLSEFLERIVDVLRVQHDMIGYNEIRNEGIRGKLTHNKLLMIARQCLAFTEDTFTEEAKTIIDDAVSTPPTIFHARFDISKWISIRANRFYSVTEDWLPSIVSQSVLPDFSDISIHEVHKWLGFSDGGLRHLSTITEIDARRNLVIEWANIEYPKVSQFTYGIYDGNISTRRPLRDAAVVFLGFIYHTLWLGLNSANLADDQWQHLKRNLRTWEEFRKYLPDLKADTLEQVDEKFYDGTIVFLWDPAQPRDVLQVRKRVGIADATDIPEDELPQFGLESDHYTVRQVLGIPQPYETHIATLSSLSIIDQNGTEIALDPIFDSDTMTYSAEITSSVTLVEISATATYDQASILLEGDEELSTLPAVFQIKVISEDEEVDETYTIVVSREEE